LKKQFEKNNVNLSVLAKKISEFFALKNFVTSWKEKGDKHIIIAAPRHFHGIAEKIKVEIVASQNEFSVEFFSGSLSKRFVTYGNLLNLFGFGYFVGKGLKSIEKLEALEKEFWVYVHQLVERLSNV